MDRVQRPHPDPLPLCARGDTIEALSLAGPLYREAGEGGGEGEGESDYWMTMRGACRLTSPSRAETLSHTRPAMA